MATEKIKCGVRLKLTNSSIEVNGVVDYYIAAFSISSIVTILFVGQPVLSLLLVFLVGCMCSAKNYWFPFFFGILAAAYLGLINTTKLPDSDLVRYLEWFEIAGKSGFIEYIALYSREPVFYAWVWIISAVFGGDSHFFIFLSTWAPYSIFSYSIVIVCRRYDVDARVAAILVMLFLFLPPLFSISAHLIRQFMAGALVTLFFARRLAMHKSSWWIIVIAIFIHYSALIFVPLALLRIPRTVHPILSFVVYGVLIYLLYLVAYVASGYLSQLPFFGMVFLRISASVIPDVVGLTTNAMFFIIVYFSFASMNLIETNSRLIHGGLYGFDRNFRFSVLLIGAIILISNISINTAEIAMRLYFYLYFLLGLVMVIFIRDNLWIARFIFIVAALEMFAFFYSLQAGVWTYAPLMKILSLPFLQLWGGAYV